METATTYKIIIDGSALTPKKNPVAGDDTSPDTEKAKGLLSKEQAKLYGQAVIAYHHVKNFATQVINHKVNTVQLRTGSNELQERASFINHAVQEAVSIAESGIGGLLLGGAGGGAAGLALSTATKVIGYVHQQQILDMQQNLENQSLQMNYIRAGARGSRGNYEQF